LLLGGGLLLLQTLGYLRNASELFWGGLFLLGGAAFLSMLVNGQWWAAFPGMSLLALGVTILLPKSLAEWGGAVSLVGIGLSFWIVYLVGRSSRWWAIIPAGVLLTLAVATLLPGRVGGFSTSGVLFLGMALTFLAVAWLSGMRWAYWTAAILGLMGALLAASLNNFLSYLWATALILSGGLLLYRYFTGRRPESIR
ncbi:MAG: hypothetical protein ACP5QU_09340, partial [Anaerolineae bacterium]